MKWTSRLATIASLIVAGSAAAQPTNPDVWDATYETQPTATDAVSEGDDHFRTFKNELRNRLEVEHQIGTQGGSPDNGLHLVGSARCFVQAAAPTVIAEPEYNNIGGTANDTLSSTEANGSTTIGFGRCWIDTDDGRLYYYGASGWTLASYMHLNSNLIYNGSFEITDGTGAVASTTVPAGWSNLNTSTIAYDDPTATSEGEGVALETIAAGGANEGVTQTLSGLKANTQYVIRARARPVTAGDDCDLQVTGGTATVTDTSAEGTNAFETLEVTATTDATPSPLVVRLEANTDTDECDWDHVTAFEKFPTVEQPGIQVCRDTDTSTTDDIYTTAGTWVDALLSCAVTIPAPGYIVEVRGQVVADNEFNGSTSALAARIRENGATVGSIAIGLAGANSDAANAFQDIVTVPLSVTRTGLTVGTTYTYTFEATPDTATATFDRNLGEDGVDDLNDGANLNTWIEVVLIPPR